MREGEPAGYLLRARQVVSATGGPPIVDGYVLTVGERIVDVGTGDPDASTDVVVIDAGEATILPGLIDCHTHVSGMHGERGQPLSDPERFAADSLDVAVGLSDLVRSGVTALRDCGYPHHAIFAVRKAAEAGRIEAPRLFLSGRALCATGGHGSSLSVEVDGVDEVRRAVRIEAKAGADWIKIMVTGGTATPGEAVSDVQLTFEEVAAAVDEAHRRDRAVCAHCSNLEGARIAIEAGIDSIEHGIVLDEELTQRMAQRGIWLCTTLRCTKVEGTAGPEGGIPAFVREKAAAIYREQMASFRRALAAGVPIAAGTDAAQPYLQLGNDALVSELELMVELGLTPARAVETATRDASKLLRADAELGTLERGKLADLIVVDGDPLADVAALRDPKLVLSRGRIAHRTWG